VGCTSLDQEEGLDAAAVGVGCELLDPGWDCGEDGGLALDREEALGASTAGWRGEAPGAGPPRLTVEGRSVLAGAMEAC
jgi:hypothetical protein